MKKLLYVIIAVFLTAALVACSTDMSENTNENVNQDINQDVNEIPEEENENKGREIELVLESWENDGQAYEVNFYYPEDGDIELYDDEYLPSWKELYHNDKNCLITFNVSEDSYYETEKEKAKNEDGYREFKIGEYDCFGLEAYGGYCVYVYFEKISEETDAFMTILFEAIDYDYDYYEGYEFYEDEELRAIAESLVYRKYSIDGEPHELDASADDYDDEDEGVDTDMLLGEWQGVDGYYEQSFLFYEGNFAIYTLGEEEYDIYYEFDEDGHLYIEVESGESVEYDVTFDGSDTVYFENEQAGILEFERI